MSNTSNIFFALAIWSLCLFILVGCLHRNARVVTILLIILLVNFVIFICLWIIYKVPYKYKTGKIIAPDAQSTKEVCELKIDYFTHSHANVHETARLTNRDGLKHIYPGKDGLSIYNIVKKRKALSGKSCSSLTL